MQWLLPLTLLAFSSTLAAQEQPYHELEFHQAQELTPWCQSEARAYFAGKGIATYQWSARYYEKGNLLIVEGTIRANGNDVPVTCRVAKGARERYAVVEVSDTP